jgi:hypothetical protein
LEKLRGFKEDICLHKIELPEFRGFLSIERLKSEV